MQRYTEPKSATRHAVLRMQQRAIPQLLVDLLMQFGARYPAGDGTTKVFLDKSARRKLGAYAGALSALLDRHLDIYLVVADDERVVTVCHRYERVRRN